MKLLVTCLCTMYVQITCLTWWKNFESQWIMGYNSPVIGKWVLPLGIHPLPSLIWGGCSTSDSELEHMIPGPSNLVHWNPLASVFVQGWAFGSNRDNEAKWV